MKRKSISDLLRDATCRVTLKDDPAETLGTAFSVSKDVAITCAHVFSGATSLEVVLDGRGNRHHVKEIELHPDPTVSDLAIIYVDEEFTSKLAMGKINGAPKTLESRGFYSGDYQKDSAELKFQARSRRDVFYEWQDNGFHIEDAFELVGEKVRGGCSGAPLLDSDSHTVVGVISSGHKQFERTWAVPLDVERRDWPLLNEIAERNSTDVARYGEAPNLKGAKDLLECQSKYALKQLKQMGKFQEDWNVKRSSALGTIKAFFKAPEPTLAIVGEANVGKTWLMADICVSGLASTAVFLRCADLNPDAPAPIGDFANDAIFGAWEREWHGHIPPTVPGLESIADVCRREEQPLLIILDGLNEGLTSRRFLEDWLPNTIGYCADIGAKIVFTTRSEPWDMISRAIPSPQKHLHLPADVHLSEKGSTIFARQRCLRLDHFDSVEVSDAAKNYDLSPSVVEMLDGHPLMFRLAHELKNGDLVSNIGVYHLVNTFIDHKLDEASRALGLYSAQGLRNDLAKLADSVPKFGGTISYSQALEAISDEGRLQLFLDTGLVGSLEGRVQISSDLIASAIRTVPSDPWTSMTSRDDSQRVAREIIDDACENLLRIDMKLEEAKFQKGLSILISTLEKEFKSLEECTFHEFFDFVVSYCESLVSFTRSLPNSRAIEIGLVYDLLADLISTFSEQNWDHQMSRWIGEANLEPAERAKRLLKVAPWYWSWPWRWSDMQRVEAHRASDANAVRKQPFLSSAGVELLLLSDEHAESVNTILIEGLADKTRIDRTARYGDQGASTISSVCAVVLFHHRKRDPRGLLVALLEDGGEEAIRLASDVTQDNRVIGVDVAIEFLSRNQNIYAASRFLDSIGSSDENSGDQQILSALQKALSTCREEYAVVLAKALSKFDPSNLASWDALAASVEFDVNLAGYMVPIPHDRFNSAVELCRKNPEIGMLLISGHDGDRDEQNELMNVALDYLNELSVSPRELGLLAEKKLYKLETSNVFEPWKDFTLKIVIDVGNDAIAPIMYPIFDMYRGKKVGFLHFPEIAKTIIDSHPDRFISILDLLWRNYSEFGMWEHLFHLMRSSNAELIDGYIATKICIGYFGSDKPDLDSLSKRILKIWSELDDSSHTRISFAASQRSEDGKAGAEVFSHEFLNVMRQLRQ